MKTKRVVTQNARICITAMRYMINVSLLLLMSVIVMLISCAKSDDLETIANYLPTVNDLPDTDHSVIIYTDIEPDFASDENLNGFYKLDLNNDGIFDFSWKSPQNTWAFWAQPNLNTNDINAIATVSDFFESYIVPINKDSVISSTLNGSYFYDSYGGYFSMSLCDTFNEYCAYSWRGETTNIWHYVY